MYKFELPSVSSKKHEWTESTVIKVALFIVISLFSLLLLPIAIVVYPFIFAWEATNTFLKAMSKKDPVSSHLLSFDPSKWSDMSLDFSNWFKEEN